MAHRVFDQREGPLPAPAPPPAPPAAHHPSSRQTVVRVCVCLSCTLTPDAFLTRLRLRFCFSSPTCARLRTISFGTSSPTLVARFDARTPYLLMPCSSLLSPVSLQLRLSPPAPLLSRPHPANAPVPTMWAVFATPHDVRIFLLVFFSADAHPPFTRRALPSPSPPIISPSLPPPRLTSLSFLTLGGPTRILRSVLSSYCTSAFSHPPTRSAILHLVRAPFPVRILISVRPASVPRSLFTPLVPCKLLLLITRIPCTRTPSPLILRTQRPASAPAIGCKPSTLAPIVPCSLQSGVRLHIVERITSSMFHSSSTCLQNTTNHRC